MILLLAIIWYFTFVTTEKKELNELFIYNFILVDKLYNYQYSPTIYIM